MAQDHDPQSEAEEPACYRILVQGQLDQDWSDWFDGMAVELVREKPPVSSLTGEVADQASLRGLLNRIWNLNLSLISLNRVEDDSRTKEKEHDSAIHTPPG